MLYIFLADAMPAAEPPPIPSYEHAFFKMFATLGLLVLLIFFTFWFIRWLARSKFKKTNAQAIEVIERKPLSPKSILYLVEVEGTRVLIAESQLEVRRLATLEGAQESKEKDS